MDNSVRLITWNVKGLGNVIKRKKILTHLKKQRANIAMLQETHLSDSEHLKLKRDWVGQLFFSTCKANTRKRGTVILIHKHFPFVLEDQISDPDGRYILITGTVYGEPFTIINIYAPNEDSPKFISKVILLFSQYCKGMGVCAGDFNCVMDQKMDKSPSDTFTNPRSSLVLKKLCNEAGIVDAWREFNKGSKEYTFYSNPHCSYSRIDYIFTPAHCLHTVSSSEIGSIVLSDHAPVQLDMIINNRRATRIWRFNSSMLNDSAFCDLVREGFKNYWSDNRNSPVSSATIWDAAKATIRGHIISYSSARKKAWSKKRQELEREVKRLECLHSKAPNQTNWAQLCQARAELNLDHTNHIKKLLFFSKQKYYEYANKSDKLLAHQIKKKLNERTIKSLKTPDGSVTYNLDLINNLFKIFYKELYKSQITAEQSDIIEFLDKLPLTAISEEDKIFLDSPLSPEEVFNAIQSMPSNKSPGPDGFPCEFYKSFWPEISHILMPALQNLLDNGVAPESWRTASICLIPKKDKDPQECASYRPISLLNTDYKILAKILARRLETVLPHIIKPDQTGFIKARFGTDNIRRLLNLINVTQEHKLPALIISLDAEKAFDRVEWKFLFATLKKFNLGSKLIKLIKLLYSNPQATVTTNGLISKPFDIQRGTRQGCPLSPLLFALIIEPLAESVRQCQNFFGIKVGNDEHRISLYADDVLLYSSEPEKSIPALLKCISDYSMLSGYKINLTKSVALPINISNISDLLPLSPFKITTSGFKYLGIFISPKLDDLFNINYTPLVGRIKKDLITWHSLPISFLGRINVIRMNILPKFLYLFQSLPCYLANPFFKDINKHLSKFIWNNKMPRINFNKLTKPKEKGGIALPNLQFYYWSAQVKHMVSWYNERTDSMWVNIEATVCAPLPIKFLPFIKNFRKIKNISTNPIILNTLLVWRDVRTYLKIPANLSLLSPIAYNPDFPISLHNIGLSDWSKLGISTISCLFLENTLKSFQQLSCQYNIPQANFFKYLQLRHFIKPLSDNCKLRLKLTAIEQIVTNNFSKGIISVIYDALSDTCTSSLDSLKNVWEKDLGHEIDNDDWIALINNLYFKCNSLGVHELNYKFINRIYLTPLRLKKIYRNSTGLCFNCKKHKGTFLHCFWYCSRIIPFWNKIHNFLQELFGLQFCFSLELYMLSVGVETVFDSHVKHMFLILVYLAKKCILLLWSSPQVPSFKMWMSKISILLPLEKLTYDVHRKSDDFWRIWSPLWHYIKNLP